MRSKVKPTILSRTEAERGVKQEEVGRNINQVKGEVGRNISRVMREVGRNINLVMTH